ncbi:helix-turn-helix domain-containing protein [Tautonia rosea]|uniref:helix-turn-helix domain-containing protein n=1 Tax=Tautonia rosea TaxID=2728037 RepID=UPI0014751F02|nr:helix-turn-helix transcriptional regulator [Tautonia rosea]
MALAERIRKTREGAGMTLEQLARAAGVSKTYLWELEQDTDGTKKPSAELLLKIANALSVTLADLMGLPSVRADNRAVEISDSLREFIERMKKLKIELTEVEIRDLATTRFRGGQPKTADDWHDLYRVLKRTVADE